MIPLVVGKVIRFVSEEDRRGIYWVEILELFCYIVVFVFKDLKELSVVEQIIALSSVNFEKTQAKFHTFTTIMFQ